MQNLDRIMRVPGTWNNKVKTDVKPVELMKNTGIRYELEQLLEMMPPDYQPKTMTRDTTVTGEVIAGAQLVLDPAAEPPAMKLATLMEEDKKFLASWKGCREDWPEDADRSPSAYDMSLSNIAARAGWTDQEITDLLIAKRREDGVDLKLREGYYAKTIAKAREPMEAELHLKRIESATTAGPSENPDAEGNHEQGRAVLDSVSALLKKVRIHTVEKYPGAPPAYVLSTDKGRVFMNGVSQILNLTKFQSAVAGSTDQVLDIKSLKKHWDSIAQAILNACEHRDVGDAGDPDLETQGWIIDYLVEKGVRGGVRDKEDAAKTRSPFMWNSRICIHIYDFQEWVNVTLARKDNVHQISVRLSRAGARNDNLDVYQGKRTTFRYWELPEDFNAAVDVVDPDPEDSPDH